MAGKNQSHTSGVGSHDSDAPIIRKSSVAGMLGGSLVALAMVIVFALANGQMFDDPAHSRLYEFTLSQAFSRFSDSDRQVPARPQSGGQSNSLAGSQMAGMDPGSQGMTPAQMQQMANFGKGSGGLGALPRQQASAQARQSAAQHAHDDGGPHTLKGNEFLRAGNHAEAVKEFQLALQENPKRLQARHSLGDSLRALKRPDEAIAAYREVLKENPQYYCCYTHIGDVEKERNNTAAAQQAYALAMEGYKKQIASGGPAAASGKFQLAKMYSDLNQNLPEALRLAEEANAATPNTFAYMQNLAQIYEKLGRKQDAIAMYDALIKLAPQHTQFLQQQKQRLNGLSKLSTN